MWDHDADDDDDDGAMEIMWRFIVPTVAVLLAYFMCY